MKLNIDCPNRLIKDYGLYWPAFFHDSLFKIDNGIPEEKAIVEFLCSKLSFGYEDPFKNEFKPFFSFVNGQRSGIFEDLKSSDFNEMKKIVLRTTNPFILAKIYDVLFIKTHEEEYRENAIKNFIKVAQYFVLQNESIHAVPYLQRTLFLFLQGKDYKGASLFLNEILKNAKNKEDHELSILINFIFESLKTERKIRFNKKDLVLVAENINDISDVYIDTLANVIEFYKSANNPEKVSRLINKYADICEQMCAVRSPHGYQYISKAIKMLLTMEESNQKRINDLEFVRQEEEKKMFDSMNVISIPLDDSLVGQINDIICDFKTELDNESDSVGKFLKPLFKLSLVSQSELANFELNKTASIFDRFTNQIIFNKKKEIIDEISCDDTSKSRKQSYAECYGLLHSFLVLFANIYLSSNHMDQNLNKLIRNISTNNELISKERVTVVEKYIIKGLSGQISEALNELIPNFEYGCKEYLRSNGIHPTYYRNKIAKQVDQNHILTMEPFRSELVKLLGEDLTKELQYLLVEKYYGNLRNRKFHEGSSDISKCENVEIMSFFRILNAYCLGFRGDVGF